MTSEHIGKKENKVEIKSISKEGVTLLIRDTEYRLLFLNFPWLRYLTVEELSTIELRDDEDIVIPSLDIELELESLESPEKYPLMDKSLNTLSNRPRQGGLNPITRAQISNVIRILKATKISDPENIPTAYSARPRVQTYPGGENTLFIAIYRKHYHSLVNDIKSRNKPDPIHDDCDTQFNNNEDMYN